MLLPSFLEMPMGPLGQGPLSTHDLVSAVLCSFSFEVFVRVSTMRKAFGHASFIVAAAHNAIQLVQLRASDGSPAWRHIVSSIFDHIVCRNRCRAVGRDSAHLGPGYGSETGRLSPPLSGAEVNIMCHYICQEV